ncbi:MAG: NUDIX hydrolase [Actinomycetota bacterium]
MAQLRAASFDVARPPDAGFESPDQARDRVLAFCQEHPDALHRTCLEGHLTGSAVVVDTAGQRTLLLHHAKLGRWLQPGGHADGDGNLAHVAWREATEETGLAGLTVIRPAIDVDIHTIPARPGEPEHLHLDVRFAVVAPDDAVVDLNHESLGSRWVEADDPAVRDAPDLARAVERALAVVRELGPISG